MQQNKKFLRVLCSLLAAALAAWCTVLLCRWVGYDLQERLGNTPSYEIINDDYSQIIDIIYDECHNIPIFNKEVPWVWNKNLNAQPHFDSGHPYYVYEMSWN